MEVILMIYLSQVILQKISRKGSSWIIDYTTFPSTTFQLAAGIPNYQELDHPRTGLLNFQNIDDNECFKWCLARYLHPANHKLRRITNNIISQEQYSI